ncbi:MAG: GNAT family N-acetyltransferase [Clostridia bacterium]|nr:GNAT family N-acetyltransferase [Clostridia bacterium]
MKHTCKYFGKRIKLLPMTQEFSEQYRIFRNKEYNRKFFFDSRIITKEAQKNWYSSYLNKSDEIMFSVFTLTDNTFIGGVGLYNIDLNNKTAEIGRIIIDKELAGGKGYGSDAVFGVCKIACDLNLKQLVAYIKSDNIPSQKTFLKNRFILDNDYNVQGEIKLYKVLF